MNNLIDEAITVLRALPDVAQEAAARAILAYGAEDVRELRPSDE